MFQDQQKERGQVPEREGAGPRKERAKFAESQKEEVKKRLHRTPSKGFGSSGGVAPHSIRD